MASLHYHCNQELCEGSRLTSHLFPKKRVTLNRQSRFKCSYTSSTPRAEVFIHLRAQSSDNHFQHWPRDFLGAGKTGRIYFNQNPTFTAFPFLACSFW